MSTFGRSGVSLLFYLPCVGLQFILLVQDLVVLVNRHSVYTKKQSEYP